LRLKEIEARRISRLPPPGRNLPDTPVALAAVISGFLEPPPLAVLPSSTFVAHLSVFHTPRVPPFRVHRCFPLPIVPHFTSSEILVDVIETIPDAQVPIARFGIGPVSPTFPKIETAIDIGPIKACGAREKPTGPATDEGTT